MAYADYLHCTECDCKVVYYAGDEDKEVLCSDCLKKYRDMITDLLYAWDWWQEDSYDREGPYDEIYAMKEHMKKLGIVVDKLGIKSVTR